jgi:NAD(P)-dependent dehydrogenase (short-subunit alcohol dehydrogenase family)
MPTPSKRVALITGANKSLGFEIARQIGRTGVTVLLGARNKAAGEDAVAKLTAEGIDAHFLAIDVTDYASVETAAGKIATGFGRLDILVNNAGINDRSDGPVPTARLDAVERVLRTNFLGALAVTRGDASPAKRVKNRPHRQCVQRAWFSHPERRSFLSVRSSKADRL